MVLSISTYQAPLSDIRFACTPNWTAQTLWSGPSAGARKLGRRMGTGFIIITTTGFTADGVATDMNAAWRPLKPPKRTSG
jgi:hypothetical protein